MRTMITIRARNVVLPLLFLAVALPGRASGHCDTMDGPVVKAGRQAVQTGNVNFALIWVQKKDEAEVRQAFENALAVGKLGPKAKEVADTSFFERLVRLHRAGEGAPYAGLKPAGQDLGPAIPASDKALQGRSIEPVIKLISDAAQAGLRRQFEQVVAKRDFNADDIEAGRGYVKAYVEYIHYVERLYEVATSRPMATTQNPRRPGVDTAS